MAQTTFDTLAYANKLKAAGFNAKLAEVQAEAQAELLLDLTQNKLATKQDIKEIKTEMQLSENRLQGNIKSLENKLMGEIKVSENKLQGNIESLDNKVQGNMESLEDRLRMDIKSSESRLLIKLGGVMVAGMGLLAALLTVFHI